MNHWLTGGVYAVLCILLIELVQAIAVHHVKRFAGCAAGGIAVALALAALISTKHHQKLAAHAAAGHETTSHLLVTGMIGVALVVTVVAYVIATLRDRSEFGGGLRLGRRKALPAAPQRIMLPPGGGYPGGY